MKINDIIFKNVQIEEGFWADIISGFKAGQRDYIARRAAELGITTAELRKQAQAHEPQSTAPDTDRQPDYHTPVAPKGKEAQPDYETPIAPAPKKTATRPAAPMPADAPQPQLRRRAKKSVPVPDIRDQPSIEQQPPTIASTSVAAAPVSPAIKQQAPLNFAQILQSIDLLSKSEQRKLLGQLLQRTNEPISGGRR